MKLQITKLSKSFDNKKVLQNINFQFESGKIYGLLGRNGAGKTTLFNCLNQDIPLDGGTICMEQDGISSPLDSREVGYVLSTPTVPEFLTGREFLKFFLDIHGGAIPDAKTVEGYFDWIHIAPEDRGRLMKDYSHGMKNKMQMLVNIVTQPKVLLLDEPLTSLDVVVAEEMKQLLRSLKGDRIIIFSTHIMDLAMDLCDEIVLLHQGQLEKIPQTDLQQSAWKEKIIAALREGDHE